MFVFTDTCEKCARVEVREFKVGRGKVLAIDEAEPKRFCTGFIGRRTFVEDLKALADLPVGEEGDRGMDEADAPEKLSVAMLEKPLSLEVEKSGFIKLSFRQPRMGECLSVGFSVQDPVDRPGEKSIQAFSAWIGRLLFQTNWRLAPAKMVCNLGFLTGELKGYSSQGDLNRLAKEIGSKKK